MHWLVLLAIALVLICFTRQLALKDDVYRLALQATGLTSAVWGFTIAPLVAQITLGVLALGCLQVYSLRT